MKVLLGTTNLSKINRFKELLNDCNLTFYTLTDLNITTEPEEQGKTPLENAVIKAKYYGQFFDCVICNDSGLYFEELPLDDPRQPGLNIRTPNHKKRLSDEEMIEYYATLIASIGKLVSAYYLDGIAVYRCGEIFSFMENSEVTKSSSFYMTSVPSSNRHPGWPLDSISINKNTMTYFTDGGNNKYDATDENIMVGEYRKRLRSFLKQSLKIE